MRINASGTKSLIALEAIILVANEARRGSIAQSYVTDEQRSRPPKEAVKSVKDLVPEALVA